VKQNYSFGLIGVPLAHSFSPVLHLAALQACGLNGSYTLFPIPPLPEGEKDLATLLERVRGDELQGLNVTIPHKQSILHLLDECSPLARSIGAVNTIYVKDGRLTGENTDAAGFLADLAALPLSENKTALVLGAGGAARAVIYALLNKGWRVHIAARRGGQANALANEFMAAGKNITASALDADNLRDIAFEPSLIVNASSAGMYPHIDESSWPSNLPFPAGACVYDLVYKPSQTRFMQETREAGLQARGGLGMLVEQAACAFELWTGQTADRSAMIAGLPASFASDLRRVQ
jgi:shikimate dehydrogenase